MATPGLFDYIKTINNKSVRYSGEEELKAFVPFIANRCFCSERWLVPVINELNQDGFTKQMVYDMFYEIIPRNNKFNQYIKKTARDTRVSHIMKYYNVNYQHAKDYMEILEESEVDRIVALFETMENPVLKKGKTKSKDK